MSTVKRIALILLIIGGVNWGLIGLFQFDLVAAIFGGQDAALARVIYTLVGLSALLSLPILFEMMTDETESDQITPSRNVNYGTEFGSDMEDPYKVSDPDNNLPK